MPNTNAVDDLLSWVQTRTGLNRCCLRPPCSLSVSG
jgi:hypothetical protein